MLVWIIYRLLKVQKFIPLLVIGVGLLVYANSFRDGFVFDDVPHIVENARIRHLWPPWEIHCPHFPTAGDAFGRVELRLGWT